MGAIRGMQAAFRIVMRLLPLFFAVAAFAQDQTVVRSIRFEHFKKVPVTEIVERLNEREVRLAVERPYHPEDAEQARHFIEELLAEKGKPNARIEVATKAVAPRRVEVRFRLLN
jgi:outer membrane protein assembly factor BamA